MQVVANFSAGPAALPAIVVEQIRADLPDWQNTGVSVMEQSHRGAPFIALGEEIEQRLRRVASISDDFDLLLLQGGATMQFALLPMNFPFASPCYQTGGHWGDKAFAEAQFVAERPRELQVNPATMEADPARWEWPDDAGFVHLTSNETIDGWQLQFSQRCAETVFCDASSDVLSRPINWSLFDVLYAGAQKNLGIAGVTLLAIRRTLWERSANNLSRIMTLKAQAEKDSMLNTPATFSWYVLGLVLQWIESIGGLEGMQARNTQKASTLYQAIDQSDFYNNSLPTPWRSQMNVVFSTGDVETDKAFVSQATDAGFLGLKGHRAVGGLRASIYNAIEQDQVAQLVSFMQEFERKHG